MYAGEIVEQAPATRLRADPQHPYTVGLMARSRRSPGRSSGSTGIPGSPPDLAAPPSGCRFNPRCPHCSGDDPALYQRQAASGPLLRVVARDHRVACHREVT